MIHEDVATNRSDNIPFDYNLRVVVECKSEVELVETNPILALGSMMMVRTSSDLVIGYKIGDGKTPFNSLPYVMRFQQ